MSFPSRPIATPSGNYASAREAAEAHGIAITSARERARFGSMGWHFADVPQSLTPERARLAGAEARANGAMQSDNPFWAAELRGAWAAGWSGDAQPDL